MHFTQHINLDFATPSCDQSADFDFISYLQVILKIGNDKQKRSMKKRSKHLRLAAYLLENTTKQFMVGCSLSRSLGSRENCLSSSISEENTFCKHVYFYTQGIFIPMASVLLALVSVVLPIYLGGGRDGVNSSGGIAWSGDCGKS